MPLRLHSAGVCLQRGSAKGWRGFIWMLKIILPVSLMTFLLEYSGLLERLDGFLEPVMGMLHLPAMAALPLLVGLVTGIYGGIAAMTVLPLTGNQMTLIAVFLLIAHNLIQEGLVQHHAGCPAWLATVVRLAAALVTVYGIGWFLGPETVQQVTGESPVRSLAFWSAGQQWITAMAWLCLKMLLIIVALMIVMEALKQSNLIEKVVRSIEPILGLMGVSRQVGLLWLTAAVLGLTYGGALIVEETRGKQLPPEQLTPLHVSIGINHAMLEDPVLFIPLGVHPFWLWIPRFVVAVIFTHLFRLGMWLRRSRTRAADAVSMDGC